MRVGVLGRTRMLVRAARAVAAQNHEISFVQTCSPEGYYEGGIKDFEDLARDMGAPVLTTSDISRSLDMWRSTRTEVCLSVNWPTLVPAQALDIFPHGILNAHAGDLPRYRGNACPNWAILNLESHVGLTVHRMVPELDAGPWLHKSFMPINESTYIGDIYAWLESAVPQAFCAALDRLATEGFTDQDPQVRPLRAFPRRPEDARIHWSASTRTVLALIRASSRPFDGAFTTLDGRETLRIWRARGFTLNQDILAVPGQVCQRNEGNPVIATADGLIEIQECSFAQSTHEDTSRMILSSLRNRLV